MFYVDFNTNINSANFFSVLFFILIETYNGKKTVYAASISTNILYKFIFNYFYFSFYFFLTELSLRQLSNSHLSLTFVYCERLMLFYENLEIWRAQILMGPWKLKMPFISKTVRDWAKWIASLNPQGFQWSLCHYITYLEDYSFE